MKKVVVFDLDETMGHFVQLSGLDYYLKKTYGRDIKREDFFKIMDMFPNVLRPNIMNIFYYLKKCKMKNYGKVKIMIYTNNTGCKMWVHRIKSYIERKLDYKLFDRVICAWKYDGKVLEKNRTSYEKKYMDLLNCGQLKKTDKILFLDDSLYEKMMNPNVTYLHVKPYVYRYNDKSMVNTYIKKSDMNLDHALKLTKIVEHKKTNCKINNNDLLFKLRGKKIERHVRNFMEKTSKQTKQKKLKKNKTRKRKINYYKI